MFWFYSLMQIHTSICYDVNIVKCYHDDYNCELVQQSLNITVQSVFVLVYWRIFLFFYFISQYGLLTLQVHIYMDKNIYCVFVNEKFVTVLLIHGCTSLIFALQLPWWKLYFKITHICSFRFHLLGDLMFLSCKNLGDWVLGGSYGCINVLCWWVWTRFLGFTLKLKRQQPLLGKQVFVVVFSDKQKIVKMRRKKIDVVPAIHADLLSWHRSALIW